MMHKIAGACFALVVLMQQALGADDAQPVTNTVEAVTKAASQEGQTISNFFNNRTPYEFWLTLLVVLMTLILALCTAGLVKSLKNVQPNDITRPVLVIFVIGGALILMTAGYDDKQVAPAFGLLGTIVGYVLSRSNDGAQRHSEPHAKPDVPAQAPQEDRQKPETKT